MPTVKPFGAWSSPIEADSLASSMSAGEVCPDETTQSIYWCETVPAEEGRGQIFSRPLNSNDAPKPLLPLGYSCRSRVHEYGGASFIVNRGFLVFSNDIDFRLYAIDLVNAPTDIKPLTPDSQKKLRYGDMKLDAHNQFIISIQEEHFDNEEPKDVVNRLVAINLADNSVKSIAEGCDFYSSARLYNNTLVYICWNHSNMPWDFTQLAYCQYEYDARTGVTMTSTNLIAGKEINESVVQPEFGIDGTLYFASDRTGYWNLYRYTDGKAELLLGKPVEQEFVGAQWRLDTSWYKPFKTDPHKLLVINKEHLAVLDAQQKSLTNLNTGFVHFSEIRTYNDEQKETAIVNVASPTQSRELMAYSIESQSIVSVLRPSTEPRLDPSYISVGKEIEFPTTDNKTAYAYFYPPTNPEFVGPENEKPPLRVLSHGGPTTATSNAYNRAIQYWTTRGFAVVDVNYGGSTGYGREFRNRLNLKWGVVDVDDCCNAAKYLADLGYVDGNKLIIEGGSAGGFTTLASLAFRNVFNAGCCRYGISDITLLAKETHKFESKYPDRLIGEYPKDKAVYEERSPLFSADKITCPVIFFQGAEDKVVPPSQSQIMVDALKRGGIPVAYVEFEGEGHGFRRAANIKRSVELELWFYGQIFGFPVDGIQGIKIENFPRSQ